MKSNYYWRNCHWFNFELIHVFSFEISKGEQDTEEIDNKILKRYWNNYEN